MTRLRGFWTAAAAVTLFLLSACAQQTAAGSPGVVPSPDSSSTPAGGDELVLRVSSAGGFVPADQLVGRLPETSVYADGRVIFNGPVTLSYPGPALPNVQWGTITPDELRKLLDRAEAAGVRPGADFGQPGVADAPTTEVTVVTPAGKRTVGVMALREARPDDPRLTAAQRQARAKLRAFVDELGDLTTRLTTGKPRQYEPEILAAVVWPYVTRDDEPGRPLTVEWPGPALPGEALNPDLKLSCVTVTGAQRDAVLAAAKNATALTPWVSAGNSWSVLLRPLLPDETGCADLKKAR
ncbi:hypothetical protein GCM10020358_33280 [Amorphoplanes nipponensis]|uniref:Uncharacterized protein n=1 Tax=Actinoplanes nipponensis TaxID=135950 RepID=A0A919JIW7_9ACTN|nr:hypothetical protein [Actinoplanes nipponensis]GIE51371.1 hypothetical protein Ani05nite_49050 [Actinoplanes nipponensis]